MTTALPPGTIFAIRYKGQTEVWKVSENGKAYGGVRRPLQPGEIVHRCVWKSDSILESRGSYQCDVIWADTGIRSFKNEPIFTNCFEDTCPAWLRG